MAGYVARYKAEAQAKGWPNWEHFYIAEIAATHEALLVYRQPFGYWHNGQWICTHNPYPELPKVFDNYESAFVWLESQVQREATSN